MELAINKNILSDGTLQSISQKYGALEDLNTSHPTTSTWYKTDFQNEHSLALKVTQVISKKYLDQFLNSTGELMGLSHYGLLGIYSVDYLPQGDDKHLVTLGFQLGEESLKAHVTKSLNLEIKQIFITIYSSVQLLAKVKSSYGLHHGNIKSANFIKGGSFFKLSEFGDSEEIQKARAAKEFKIESKLIDDIDLNDSLMSLNNEYLSPEIRNSKCLPSDEKEEKTELFANDAYALGIVLLEMFGNPVHKLKDISPASIQYSNQLKAYKEVIQARGGIALKKLADRMLEANPSQRIAIEEIADRLTFCAQKMGLNLEQEVQDLISSENPGDDSKQEHLLHLQALNKELAEARSLMNEHKFKEALMMLEQHLLEVGKLSRAEEKKGGNLILQVTYLLEMGKVERAIDVCSEALALYDGLFGKENATSAKLLCQFADCYDQRNDMQKAIDLVTKSLKITKGITGEYSYAYASSLSIKGLYHNEKDEFTQALADLASAREIFENLYGKKSISVADNLSSTAIVFKTMRNYHKALDCAEKAYFIYRELKHSDPETMYNLYLNMGAIQSCLLKDKEGINCLLRALELGEKIYGPESLGLCSVLLNIGCTYTNTGDYAKAARYLEKGLEIRKQLLPSDSLHVASSMRGLAALYSKTGRVAEAREMFQMTMEIRKKKLGENHPDTAAVFDDLGACFHKENQFDTAVYYYNKAINVQKQFFSRDNQGLQRLVEKRDLALARKAYDSTGIGYSISKLIMQFF